MPLTLYHAETLNLLFRSGGVDKLHDSAVTLFEDLPRHEDLPLGKVCLIEIQGHYLSALCSDRSFKNGNSRFRSDDDGFKDGISLDRLPTTVPDCHLNRSNILNQRTRVK